LESTTWTVAHFKLGNLMLACVLSFGLGAGGVAFAFKMWGPTLSSLFSLPRATDARLTILSSEGAVLRVQSKEGTTYVWLEGSIEAREGQSKTGVSYLYFRP